MTTRVTEPTQITQGERVAWTKTLDDYSAALYTLSYRFRGGDGPGFNVTATASGTDFAAVIAADVSIKAKPGVHKWQAWLTLNSDSTKTFIVGEGQTTVKRGFASDTSAAIDLRSPAKKALDSIDAAMEAFATSDVLEYEITTPAGSRRVKRSARADLLNLRKYYAGVVAREDAAERARTTGKFGKSVNVRVYDNG